MIFFGHLGVGSEIVAQAKKRNWIKGTLSLKWVLLGTIFPDLIDKPLYYGLSFFTHLHGGDLGLISGTRTFGHCIPATFVIAVALWKWHPKLIRSLFFGILTHQFLDLAVSAFSVYFLGGKYNFLWEGFFFPFFGLHFPIHPFANSLEHAKELSMRLDLYIWEGVGLILIYFGWIKRGWFNRVRSKIA